MLRKILDRLRGKTKVFSSSKKINGAMSSGKKDQRGQWYKDIY